MKTESLTSDPNDILDRNRDERFVGKELVPSKNKLLADRIAEVCLRVCELPDRSSPEDWPEACLVTPDELSEILEEVFGSPDESAAWLVKIDGKTIGLFWHGDLAREAAAPITGAVVVPLYEHKP
jgi:hypothetical protein